MRTNHKIKPKDKRDYDRLQINIEAVIINLKTGADINSIVKDISELGIQFETEEDIDKIQIQIGDIIGFQFYDEFNIVDQNKKYVITGKAIVRHIEQENTGTILGCYIAEKYFKKYVEDRKIKSLVKNLDYWEQQK